MKVLVTGANGFIAKNLLVHLRESKKYEILIHNKEHSSKELEAKVKTADFVFHLAGVNRPQNNEEFQTGNTDLTRKLCDFILSTGRSIPVVFSSSIQASLDNPYGNSKRDAESAIKELSSKNGSTNYIYRLPNVFGKWAKPNYNSAVATFCYNVLNDLPVKINDPSSVIKLAYVDDVIKSFLKCLEGNISDSNLEVQPVYEITVGDLEKQLRLFKDSLQNSITERVGTGLTRALYSTYISYYRPENFSYDLVKHEDPRGIFVEMLKTKDSGQFSFFTAKKGITRGSHYHHTKTEKFLVIKGEARFGFRHIETNETYELLTNSNQPKIVETIPGWTHDITNVGEDEMIVMLWANEIFDRENPDTIPLKV